MRGIPEHQRHVLRRLPNAKGTSTWECTVCFRKESRKRLESTKCMGPGAKTKSELLALQNAERVKARRAEELSAARAHNRAVQAAGKGQLRHAPVPDGDGEKCEECGRWVPGSSWGRVRSGSTPALAWPGPPQPGL